MKRSHYFIKLCLALVLQSIAYPIHSQTGMLTETVVKDPTGKRNRKTNLCMVLGANKINGTIYALEVIKSQPEGDQLYDKFSMPISTLKEFRVFQIDNAKQLTSGKYISVEKAIPNAKYCGFYYSNGLYSVFVYSEKTFKVITISVTDPNTFNIIEPVKQTWDIKTNREKPLFVKWCPTKKQFCLAANTILSKTKNIEEHLVSIYGFDSAWNSLGQAELKYKNDYKADKYVDDELTDCEFDAPTGKAIMIITNIRFTVTRTSYSITNNISILPRLIIGNKKVQQDLFIVKDNPAFANTPALFYFKGYYSVFFFNSKEIYNLPINLDDNDNTINVGDMMNDPPKVFDPGEYQKMFVFMKEITSAGCSFYMYRQNYSLFGYGSSMELFTMDTLGKVKLMTKFFVGYCSPFSFQTTNTRLLNSGYMVGVLSPSVAKKKGALHTYTYVDSGFGSIGWRKGWAPETPDKIMPKYVKAALNQYPGRSKVLFGHYEFFISDDEMLGVTVTAGPRQVVLVHFELKE